MTFIYHMVCTNPSCKKWTISTWRKCDASQSFLMVIEKIVESGWRRVSVLWLIFFWWIRNFLLKTLCTKCILMFDDIPYLKVYFCLVCQKGPSLESIWNNGTWTIDRRMEFRLSLEGSIWSHHYPRGRFLSNLSVTHINDS